MMRDLEREKESEAEKINMKEIFKFMLEYVEKLKSQPYCRGSRANKNFKKK